MYFKLRLALLRQTVAANKTDLHGRVIQELGHLNEEAEFHFKGRDV